MKLIRKGLQNRVISEQWTSYREDDIGKAQTVRIYFGWNMVGQGWLYSSIHGTYLWDASSGQHGLSYSSWGVWNVGFNDRTSEERNIPVWRQARTWVVYI